MLSKFSRIPDIIWIKDYRNWDYYRYHLGKPTFHHHNIVIHVSLAWALEGSRSGPRPDLPKVMRCAGTNNWSVVNLFIQSNLMWAVLSYMKHHVRMTSSGELRGRESKKGWLGFSRATSSPWRGTFLRFTCLSFWILKWNLSKFFMHISQIFIWSQTNTMCWSQISTMCLVWRT